MMRSQTAYRVVFRVGMVVSTVLLLAAAACSSGSTSAGVRVHGRWATAGVDLALLRPDMLPVKVLRVVWDEGAGAPVVLLDHPPAALVVPIWVGPAEGNAIAGALAGNTPPRPQTHDLMDELVTALDGRLEEVWIHAMADSTYLGLLKLTRSRRFGPVLVDTRPSDGIALALRAGVPILMHRRIIEAAGLERSDLGQEVEQIARGLGMTVAALSDEEARERGITVREGVIVRRSAGEALDAGVQVGDVVLRLAGRSMTGVETFVSALMALRQVEDVELIVLRAGQELRLVVVPRPADLIPRRREAPLPVA